MPAASPQTVATICAVLPYASPASCRFATTSHGAYELVAMTSIAAATLGQRLHAFADLGFVMTSCSRRLPVSVNYSHRGDNTHQWEHTLNQFRLFPPCVRTSPGAVPINTCCMKPLIVSRRSCGHVWRDACSSTSHTAAKSHTIAKHCSR